MTKPKKDPNEWVPICENCWYAVDPNDHFPYHLFSEWSETCHRCGEPTFANVHVRREWLDAHKSQVGTNS